MHIRSHSEISPSTIFTIRRAELATLKMLNEKFGDILEAELTEQDGYSDSMTGLIDTLMDVIIGVIYSVSAVFALVAVHMVCSKAFLRERRDSGIYKALGFTSGRLRICFALRFLIISVIGGVLGAVLSAFFSDRLLSLLLKNIDITCFDSKINVFTALLPVLMICLCFLHSHIFHRAKSKRSRSESLFRNKIMLSYRVVRQHFSYTKYHLKYEKTAPKSNIKLFTKVTRSSA